MDDLRVRELALPRSIGVGSVALSLLVVLLGAAGIGCTSVDEARATRGEPAKKVLAAAAAAEADLRSRALGASAVSATNVVVDVADVSSDANATIAYVEDLAKPGELGNVYARIPGSDLLTTCASFADHGTYPWDPRDTKRWTEAVAGWEVEGRLKRCAKTQWLLVVRTVSLARPSPVRIVDDAGAPSPTAGEANEATCSAIGTNCTFGSAYVKAEVHVYGLAPVAHRGVFVVEAESSEKIMLRAGSEAARLIESDLATRFATALRAGLLEAVPGADVKGLK